jgi:uncharacterized protein
MMPRPRLSTLLVKPAGPDCNMACDYCFYLEKRQLFGEGDHRMRPEVLQATTRGLLRAGGDAVTFIWQGGEPTLMGLPFYREALRLQRAHRRPGQRVENALMTNGLLLDDAWCDVLLQGEFLLGLSIDGPQDLHDGHRRLSGGQPSWERVLRSARLLLRRGVPVNAVVLASRDSCGRGREIYQTLAGLGFDHLQLIPCVEPDPQNPGELAPFSVTPEDFGDLLCELFDCWAGDLRDGMPALSIRWFDAVLQRYLGLPPQECTLAETCGTYLVVEHQGNVYSCDFYVDPGHLLGNVLRDPLDRLFAGEAQRGFGLAKGQLTAECLECPWLELCQGGCPKDRLAGGQSHLCASYRRFFSHADGRLRELAARYQQRRRAGRALRKVGRNAPCPCGSGRKHKHCCGRSHG